MLVICSRPCFVFFVFLFLNLFIRPLYPTVMKVNKTSPSKMGPGGTAVQATFQLWVRL